MKVLLTKKFADSDIQYLTDGLLAGIELVHPPAYDEGAIIESLPIADVLLGGMLSEKVVSQAKHVRFAQIPWTGVENLKFDMLDRHNITICNSHSNAALVAEHAIALAFAAAKKITYHDRQMREGNWNRISPNGNPVSPFSKGLANSKVTFLGYGAIARATHQFLKPFNPIVTAVTKTGINKTTDDNLKLFKTEGVCDAVCDADFVFVCMPLTEESRDFVNQDVFSAMPDHGIFINVSRGAIVEEEALFRSLSENHIGGAAIDTWYQNPKPDVEKNFPSANYSFQSLENLVMSPHRAGYCDSGFPHLDDAIDNLNRSLQGRPLINVISTSMKY